MTEFDRHAETYEAEIQDSIRFSRREHAFFLQAKATRLRDVARRRVGDPTGLRTLDVGCGDGAFDSYLGEVHELEGVDSSKTMIARARKRNPQARYQTADGTELPFPHASFDLTFAVCVLHHVPTPARDRFVAELRRVTRPGGLVVLFEHNRWNPLTRLAVSRCEFDRDAELVGLREASGRLESAGLRPVEHRYILFFPWSGRAAARVESILAPLPLGAQYYVAAHA